MPPRTTPYIVIVQVGVGVVVAAVTTNVPHSSLSPQQYNQEGVLKNVNYNVQQLWLGLFSYGP